MSRKKPQGGRWLTKRLLVAVFFPIAAPLRAATITVNSTADVVADDGQCTLREAIIAANTNIPSGAMVNECAAGAAGLDTIQFAISGAGVKTITPTSALPPITEAISINGYTQGVASANTLAVGDNAVILIEIDGSSAGVGASGLVITAGSSTVRGLAINRFNSGGFSDSGMSLQTAGC